MRQGGRDRGKGEGLEGIAVCLVQQGEAHLPFARHATPEPRNRNQYPEHGNFMEMGVSHRHIH